MPFFAVLCVIVITCAPVTLVQVGRAWLKPLPRSFFARDKTAAARPPERPAGALNLNTATLSELMSLPGVGEITAGAILAFRDEHGGINYVEDLLEVRGIGRARLDAIYAQVYAGEQTERRTDGR